MKKTFGLVSLIIILTVTLSALMGLGVASADQQDSDWRESYVMGNMTYDTVGALWSGSVGQYKSFVADADYIRVFANANEKVAAIYTFGVGGALTFGDTGWCWIQQMH